ncbi:MAG: hypothetical protein QXX08_05665 [Candidatus Bathyarchaeia archaeon]
MGRKTKSDHEIIQEILSMMQKMNERIEVFGEHYKEIAEDFYYLTKEQNRMNNRIIYFLKTRCGCVDEKGLFDHKKADRKAEKVLPTKSI